MIAPRMVDSEVGKIRGDLGDTVDQVGTDAVQDCADLRVGEKPVEGDILPGRVASDGVDNLGDVITAVDGNHESAIVVGTGQ